MRINEVAGLSGVTPKEVMELVELKRGALTEQGFKINKKLTASSTLDDTVAAEIAAEFDRRRQNAKASENEAEKKREAEEAERKRVAEIRRRQAAEEEERKKAEERRKVADAEIARRQEELARQQAAAAPKKPAAPSTAAVAAAPAPAAPAPVVAPVAPPPVVAAAPASISAPPPTEIEKPAAPPPPAPAPVAAAAPAPAVETPPAAPVAPAATTVSPASVTPTAVPPAPAPQAARPSAPVPPMVRQVQRPPTAAPSSGEYRRPPREGDSRPPRDGDSRGGPPREGYRPPREGAYQPREGAPRPPREGGYQGRDGSPRPTREGGYPPREGGPRPQREGGYPPREGGYQARDGAPRPPREGGYPPREGGYPPREGGYRPREGDSRPPRVGPDGRPMRPSGPSDRPFNRDARGPAGPGRPPRPGDPSRGPRPTDGRPGGPRPTGDRSGPGRGGFGATETPSASETEARNRRGERRRDGPKDRARETTVKDFLEQGLGTELKDSFGRPRTPGAPGRPAAAPGGPGRKRTPGGGGDKRIRPSKIFGVEEDDSLRNRKGRKQRGSQPSGDSSAPRPKVIALHGDFTVSEFAQKCSIEPAEVIKKLFLMGELLTMNQVLDPDLAELIASEFGVEVEIHREGDTYDVEEFVTKDAEGTLVPRPPVVTVMGHVDHGKTTLLDRIRSANVAAGEAGGMTQHIGAYHVSTAKGDIIFLDTPGHEAFTAMRARGAQVTDLVILVVAANDGVMPQTIEAINHAKAANVPIVVAINKVDANGADPMRVKQELMKYNLVSEEFGGETIMAPVSALKGTGVDSLLEMVALQAEVLELKANPNANAEGAIIESRIDPARGAVASVLIRRGTLRIGDVFICGTETGRVRAMFNDQGKPVTEASPSMPVEILGLSGSPGAGEHFIVMPDEATAREIADRRSRRRRSRGAQAKTHITLENLAEHIAEGEVKTFNVVVKGDVQGSVEAIRGSLTKIKSTKVAIRVLHSGVGGVTTGDVQLADASDAVVIGFNVRPDAEAISLAERLGVEIRLYDIIFNLIADVEKAMAGMLAPIVEEKEEGRARVQQPFKISGIGTIAGCMVESGTIARDHHARLVRDGVVVWKGKLASLRHLKDDVKSITQGKECGIGLERFNDVKSGDIIETYTIAEKAASLTGEA